MAHSKETAVKIIPAIGRLAKRVGKVIKEKRVGSATKNLVKDIAYRIVKGTGRR